MSSLSPDYVVPQEVIEKTSPLWESALDASVPCVGKPIEVFIPLPCQGDPSGRRLQELFGGMADAFGAVSNVAEVKAVVLNFTEYHDLRRFGRDVFDFDDIPMGLYPLGMTGRLWGAYVITNSVGVWVKKYARPTWVPQGTLFVVGQCKDGSWVKQEIRVTRAEPMQG